ncbi:putative FBD-associated F-box protein At5g44940 [Lotus japonicus]|uniref:putative FBD-associated F-box protein At5g44940 n=1 Tax=Lotus japonicus TaxID=34305 RepID=UPI00258E4958|nr:putative FBD-associated F-box protein At5g44940 [Lotus japonicus]
MLRVSKSTYTTSCATLLPNIFRCQTLVCLKLSRISKVGKISSVDLPLLKSLHLFKVCFHNEKEDYRKFLNGAPILEDLYVADTSSSRSVHVVGTKTSNLVKAHLRPCIPNPQYFRRFKEYFSSPKFPNLIHLEFVFNCIPFSGWPTVLGMLYHCPRLQNLVIKKRSLEKHSYIETEEYSIVPVPECVSSHLRTCFIGSILNIEDDFRYWP